ncbi:ABC-F family ATP-binding cassette domain-containing protein [Candidatus Cyanaurora vandensis]|uniref:ABC-F family ATP-binding cassette domain-containing protein n=1 Tax=Candidatus Cyanaurora vandensis TaxID=2714958 RepID=UPI00257E3E01|nr:ABC-F family ATP-binding cassette domain-containing protein [Candidatus Cyanaurora vandensis]
MTIFTLQGVQKHFGVKPVLNNASFSLDQNDKIGLIGTNGSGKSTLLKIIAGLEHADAGQRLVNPGVRMVYLPQEPQLAEDLTVLEQVFAANPALGLLQEYEQLSEQLALGEDVLTRLSQIAQQLDESGAWDLETNAKIVLSKLGIEDIHARVGSLSGGYRKRIALAVALLAQPDVLLMDEPTNHLDALAVEWLQEYLNRFRGALLLITHDRYFLDQVTTRILEIDRGDLYSYQGNYSYYLEKKALAEESSLSSQRKHQGLLRRELDWLSRGPQARSTKQKARIQRAHELQDKEFKEVQGRVAIDTPTRRIGNKVIELTAVSKSYGDRVLIKNFTHLFGPDDRVGIIGSNGMGKTTLMDIIIGRIPPDSGLVDIGSTIHFGYFDQHSDALLENLDPNQRVIDYLKEEGEFVATRDGIRISAAQMLERFLFYGPQQYVPIQKLSGGEKRRLFLLRVLMSAPNVLILDEPTNDLDVQTLSVLEEYLEQFTGAVLVVSHDRYFLDRTVETILALEGGGEVRAYTGNYAQYLAHRPASNAPTKSPSAKSTPTASPTATIVARTRKLTNKEKREFATLESKIAQLELQKTQAEQALQANLDFNESQKLYDQLAKLTQTIETTTERWLELAEFDS